MATKKRSSIKIWSARHYSGKFRQVHVHPGTGALIYSYPRSFSAGVEEKKWVSASRAVALWEVINLLVGEGLSGSKIDEVLDKIAEASQPVEDSSPVSPDGNTATT